MNLLYGEILTPVLAIGFILFDMKRRDFRGIVQQLLAALCAGTVLNSIVNLHTYPSSAGKSLILYLVLTAAFLYWAHKRRQRFR